MRGRILYGISKEDNTKHIINEVNKYLKKGYKNPLYIIVPEQYSSMYEQEMVNKSIEKGLMQVKVTTFKKLASKIFVDTLQKRNDYIDDAGKSIIIYDILENFKDKLEAFKKVAKYSSFSIEISKLIKEFKKYEITFAMLYELSINEKNKLLSQKLVEISFIYEQYEENIKLNKYYDSDDDLSLLADVIKNHNVLDNSIIWLDKFNGFTSQEYSCIREMLKKADTFSICFNTPQLRTKKNSDIFYPILDSYEKIEKIAQEENHILEEIFIKENEYRTKELQYLCDNYFSYNNEKYMGIQNSIEIYRASNIYEEIKKTAIDISKLVREKELRYRDIVIGCSLLNEYENYIEAIFNSYNIPFFISNKRPINKHALINYIIALLQIYEEKYSFEAVFSFLKSEYSGFDSSTVNILENYVLEWDIKGVALWNSEWTFKKDNSIYENNKLTQVNSIREKLVERLNGLFDKIKNKHTPIDFLTHLYNFLIENNVYANLQKRIENATNNNQHEYVDELKQSWNIIITIFNQINTVLKNTKYTTSKYIDMLNIAFSTYEIGVIPPSNDKVEITSVNRSSSINKKVLFILGANEPSFPNEIKKDGILSDSDRVTLKEKGINLASDSLTQVIEQRLVIYEVISMPYEKLYVSYSISDLSYKSRRPSYIVEKILNMYEDIKEKNRLSFNDLDFIYTPMMGLEEINKNNGIGEILKKWYIDNEFKLYIQLNKRKSNYKITKKEAAKLLYNDTINMSVSKLETFTHCPFSFFVEYGLKAKKRDVFSLKPPDIGSIIHDMLGSLLKNKVVGDENILFECKKIFNEKTKNKFIFNRDNRLRFLGERIIERVIFSYNEIVRQIDNGEFEPSEFEISFGKNKQLPPIEFYTKDENRIMLQGRIDRVDKALVDEKEVFRIIDYKLSNKKLALYKIKEGIDLQLAIYLYAYYKNTKSIPGGMYYFGTQKPIVSVDGLDNITKVSDLVHYKTRLEGYTLEEEDIKKLNDKNNEKKSSVFDNRKLISKEKIDNMFHYINKIVKENTEKIYNLENEAYPIKEGEFIQCKYCEYKSICGFDIEDSRFKYKEIEKMKDGDVEFNE